MGCGSSLDDAVSAIREGQPQQLRTLLRNDEDLAIARLDDTDQSTLLHLAASKNQLECALILLQKGADITAVDARNRSVLHVAAEGHAYDTLRGLTGVLLDQQLYKHLRAIVHSVDSKTGLTLSETWKPKCRQSRKKKKQKQTDEEGRLRSPDSQADDGEHPNLIDLPSIFLLADDIPLHLDYVTFTIISKPLRYTRFCEEYRQDAASRKQQQQTKNKQTNDDTGVEKQTSSRYRSGKQTARESESNAGGGGQEDEDPLSPSTTASGQHPSSSGAGGGPTPGGSSDINNPKSKALVAKKKTGSGGGGGGKNADDANTITSIDPLQEMRTRLFVRMIVRYVESSRSFVKTVRGIPYILSTGRHVEDLLYYALRDPMFVRKAVHPLADRDAPSDASVLDSPIEGQVVTNKDRKRLLKQHQREQMRAKSYNGTSHRGSNVSSLSAGMFTMTNTPGQVLDPDSGDDVSTVSSVEIAQGTPLHVAICLEHAQILHWLLLLGGTDQICIQDSSNSTTLHHLVSRASHTKNFYLTKTFVDFYTEEMLAQSYVSNSDGLRAGQEEVFTSVQGKDGTSPQAGVESESDGGRSNDSTKSTVSLRSNPVVVETGWLVAFLKL